jgi:RNA-directed DNA polymerase
MTRKQGKLMKEGKQMMGKQFPGAPAHEVMQWQTIDWEHAHRIVNRLQVRIVKATQARKWSKVKALQRLLTHSLSGKALAVKRVTENQGKRTSGVDGETWTTPEKKVTAIQTLRQRGYHVQPLRRVYIPKGNGKRRPLGIPTMRDRAMQALYLLAVSPIAETQGDRHSYGFRLKRSTADAIEQCFTLLAKAKSPQWILEGDIHSCFDEISHDWLLAHIPMESKILSQWLKAGVIDRHVRYPTEAGTPQGGLISPTIANMTLDGLEAMVQGLHPKTTRQGHAAKVNLVRFADDFIITAKTRELLEEMRPRVAEFLRERGLVLSEEKTSITYIADGFDFLGQNIRKYHDKLLIKPAQNSVKAVLRQARELIKRNKATSASDLIDQLNPLLRGWANYHRHVVSKRIFEEVDHAIFHMLWQWAKRRHPRKSLRWVKSKYFGTVQGDHWVFFGETRGDPKVLYLCRTAQMKIRRHRQIKAEANPYDPVWADYFFTRLGLKMVGDLHEKQEIFQLWKAQQGQCPMCRQAIATMAGWEPHYVIWRNDGDTDGTKNHVLFHPHCHRKLRQALEQSQRAASLRGGVS